MRSAAIRGVAQARLAQRERRRERGAGQEQRANRARGVRRE